MFRDRAVCAVYVPFERTAEQGGYPRQPDEAHSEEDELNRGGVSTEIPALSSAEEMAAAPGHSRTGPR